jgi:multimeric flavodoxin WrbA
MKIIILNGNPDGKNKPFDRFLEKLGVVLEKENHTVKILELRNMDINYCTGCWGCWVKTPGQCVIHDDSNIVCDETINSDLVIFASPLIMGFISATLKKTMDRMISLLHPYIEFVEKECHHCKRYDKYPLLGLILDENHENFHQDITITIDIFKRFSLNFRSKLQFTGFAANPVQEVINEINHI